MSMRMQLLLLPFLALLLGCSSARAQDFLGPYTGYAVQGKAITVFAAPSAIRFMFYQSDIVRVDFLPDSLSAVDSSFVVVQDTTEDIPVSIVETDSTLRLSTSGMTIVCRKDPLRLSYYDTAGGLLLADGPLGGFATGGSARWAVFSLGPDEHFYGTGERGTGLDRRGLAFESYNTQVFGYGGPVSSMNITVPFLASTNGYALYFENTWRGNFDLGHADPSRFHYRVDGGELSYYLFSAPSLGVQLERYTWLTGRAPLPPRWAFGYIQSRFGYHNEAEVRTTVQTMRTKMIPCDAIVLDLYWFTHMGDLAWNSSAWPAPFALMSDLRSQGVKTILITEPYIVQYSPNYGVATANAYFARTASGGPYVLQNWWSCNCNAGLVDLTGASTREWWWSLYPPFMGNHVAGLWTDLGEPERHPDDMVHHLGPARKVHNIYNLLWARTLFEGHRQTWPDRRLFNLTRSGYAGIQRFGVVTWSGDVARSFGGLAVQLPILLGMGMSGIPYHNSDIGGFCCGTTTPELYTRWMQFGAFSPVMRAHGSTQPTEPWAFGPATEGMVRKLIELRYRLLPYTYTLAREAYATGMPPARPLVLSDPENPTLRNHSSSYLWGNAFLVSPVVEDGQRTKAVTLPAGEWVDFWTEEEHAGGQTVVVNAPLDRIPLFVRTGSIVPMAPLMQSSDERPLDTLMLAVYPAQSGEARFELYEDDGVSLAYQTGSSARTLFLQQTVATDSGLTLIVSIGATGGSYTGMPLQRVFLTEIHGVRSGPTRVTRDGAEIPRRSSYDDLRQQGDGFFYDAGSALLYMHTPLQAESSAVLQAENVRLSAVRRGSGTMPEHMHLEQNYPNPVNGQTRIGYSIGGSGDGRRVTLKVFDVLGREVATLVNEKKGPGSYAVDWDAAGLPSGLYLYRLAAGDFLDAKKLILLR